MRAMSAMRRILGAACVVAACAAAGERMPGQEGCPQPERGWCPARFGELVVGASSRTDVLRALGEPAWQEQVGAWEDDPGELWYHYRVTEPVPGELVAVFDSAGRTLRAMDLLADSLSMEEALRVFGPSPTPGRYAPDDCLGDGESSPMYESPEGSWRVWEYRGRGIVVVPRGDTGLVEDIRYLPGPFAPAASLCAGEET